MKKKEQRYGRRKVVSRRIMRETFKKRTMDFLENAQYGNSPGKASSHL